MMGWYRVLVSTGKASSRVHGAGKMVWLQVGWVATRAGHVIREALVLGILCGIGRSSMIHSMSFASASL